MGIMLLQQLGREAAWPLLSSPPHSCNHLLGCNPAPLAALPPCHPNPEQLPNAVPHRSIYREQSPPWGMPRPGYLCLDGAISAGKGILQSIRSATQTQTKSPRKAHVSRAAGTMGTAKPVRHRGPSGIPRTGATATPHGYAQFCARGKSITKEIIKVAMSHTQNLRKCEN